MEKLCVDLPKNLPKKKPSSRCCFRWALPTLRIWGCLPSSKMPYTQSPSRSRFGRHRTRRRLVRNQWEPAGSFKEPMWFHQKSTRKKSLNSKRDIKMNLWLMTNPKIYISWADLGGPNSKRRDAPGCSIFPSFEDGKLASSDGYSCAWRFMVMLSFTGERVIWQFASIMLSETIPQLKKDLAILLQCFYTL